MKLLYSASEICLFSNYNCVFLKTKTNLMSSNCTLEETKVRERNLLSHIANMILAANENALVIGGLTAPGQQDCEKECFLKIIKNSETTKNIFFTRRLRLRMNGVLTATGQRENGGSGREGTASNEGKSHCAINLFLCWAVCLFFFLKKKLYLILGRRNSLKIRIVPSATTFFTV